MGGTYVRSKEIFKNVFGQFAKYWKGWAAFPEELLSINNRIIILGYYKGESIKTGNYMEASLVHIHTLNTGLIPHFLKYTDTCIAQSALNHDWTLQKWNQISFIWKPT